MGLIVIILTVARRRLLLCLNADHNGWGPEPWQVLLRDILTSLTRPYFGLSCFFYNGLLLLLLLRRDPHEGDK